MAKTRKGVNPIDQEIKEEMMKEAEVVNDTIEDETISDDFETPEDVLEENPFTPEEQVAKEIVLPKRYILSECIYKPSNPERGSFDFGDFLIDLESVGSIERVFPERLADFGIDEHTIEDQNLLDSCIIWSSALPEEVIVLDFNFEELTQSLIEYRGTSL